MVETWSAGDTCSWLELHNLSEAKQTFLDEQIDGETLLGLTESMVTRLFPRMKQQVKFLTELNNLRGKIPVVHAENADPPSSLNRPASSTSTTWPAVYSLPAFTPEVKEALVRKDSGFFKKDKSHLRAALITLLFDDITRYTWYPSHKMYSDVMDALITKYTFLRDGSHSGFDILLECLKNKFKKERRPLVHMEKVREMKTKYGIQKRSSTSEDNATATLPKRRLPLNAESVEDIGEDEQSIEEHLKAMKAEMDKSRPNIDQIKSRMRRTLHARTGLYKKTATEVFQQCPFLKVPCLLLYEMELRYGQDIDASLSGFLHGSAGRIVETTKGPLQASLAAAIAEADSLKAKDLLSNAGVLLLPILMKENSKLLYCINEEPVAVTPTILFRSEHTALQPEMVSIKMDGSLVLGPSPDIDATLGLACLLALYFLFQVEYPKGARHTLLFFERCVKLSTSKPSTAVLRVEKMLKP